MQYPNDSRIYYWKPYDGSNQTFDALMSKNPNGTWNGRWVEFETQETIAARNGQQMADGLGAFFAIGLTAVVASPAIASGSALLISAGDFALLNIGARIYPYLPIVAQVGNKAIEFLDETGMAPSSSFTTIERDIIKEARSILNSKELGVLKQAFNKGSADEVVINGRRIIFEPDLPGSGFSLHGENAFLIGKEAFTKSPQELGKTILHELYRLFTQGTKELDVDKTRRYTDAAQQFAEKAYSELNQ